MKGTWTFPRPNSHQPYLAWRAKDRAKYDKIRTGASLPHSGCNSIHKSRTPDCTAAFHRQCNSLGYGAGISQEVGTGVFGVACFNPDWYGDISIASLQEKHSGCTLHTSQGSHCVAAVHRKCESMGYRAGISQEVGAGVFGVACFNPDWYGDISIASLQEKHSGCTLHTSQGSHCVAAVHRKCESMGYRAGISQEVGAGVFGVACFNVPWYNDMKL